jgi:tyrosinase
VASLRDGDLTPPGQGDRNAAHRGPVFLPWHRFMLILLELQLQRVLSDPDFGLPYWDWAADGELPAGGQSDSPLWADDCMGGEGSPVTTGPFAFDPADPGAWRVRVVANMRGRVVAANRGLRRGFARASPPCRGSPTGGARRSRLPGCTTGCTSGSAATCYRRPRPTTRSATSTTATWTGSGPRGRRASLLAVPARPERLAVAGGHRIDDDMYALLTRPVTPRQMLDPSDLCSYDSLAVS